jgi:hypothetical protein
MAAAVWNFDGHPRRFREIVSRRKKKKGGREQRNTSKCVGLFALVAAQVWTHNRSDQTESYRLAIMGLVWSGGLDLITVTRSSASNSTNSSNHNTLGESTCGQNGLHRAGGCCRL